MIYNEYLLSVFERPIMILTVYFLDVRPKNSPAELDSASRVFISLCFG